MIAKSAKVTYCLREENKVLYIGNYIITLYIYMYFNKGRHIRIFHKISFAMGQIKESIVAFS
jgi:hypothetical protein